ncbi:MAG: energy transducer TonB [Chitinophagaceae bacterium]|nr:energy transducer TonB [Chitinophagaceae bacterium]
MNRNQILKTDILDIIFENRNKAYGAYELRKFYPTRIKNALFFMAITSAAFLVFTLLPKKESTMIKTDFPFPEIILKDVFIEPEKPAIKREIEKPVAEAAKPLNAEPGNNTTKIDVTIPMDLDAVDVPPTFPGGMDALKNFLERNLKNPYDLENGETINVRIRFVVGYNGKLQSFTTVFDGGEIYNKEVIRVLKKMPDWQPGKARGENVSVYYTIPVKFVMSD